MFLLFFRSFSSYYSSSTSFFFSSSSPFPPSSSSSAFFNSFITCFFFASPDRDRLFKASNLWHPMRREITCRVNEPLCLRRAVSLLKVMFMQADIAFFSSLSYGCGDYLDRFSSPVISLSLPFFLPSFLLIPPLYSFFLLLPSFLLFTPSTSSPSSLPPSLLLPLFLISSIVYIFIFIPFRKYEKGI